MDSETPGRPSYWEGTAELFDGRQAKARPTPVAIGPDGLDLLDGEAAGRYRAGDLELIESAGGDFFSVALKPHAGAVLAFRSQPQALEWLRAAGLLKRPAFSGLSLRDKILISVGFLAAFCGFMGFAGLDLIADATVTALPPGVDRALGSSVERAFDDSVVKTRDAAALRALAKSAGMVRGLRPGYADSVRILIVRDTAVKNAFAFPGGTIVVFTGMLHMLDSQEEWMGLLAHEGGHLHLRHGTRRIVRGSLLGVGATLLFGDMSGVGSVLVDNASTLMNLSYGRRDEAAADAFALARLRAGGYATSGLQSLFLKFLRFKELPGWAKFLSTHPATKERIAALKGAETGPAGPKGTLLSPDEWTALKHL